MELTDTKASKSPIDEINSMAFVGDEFFVFNSKEEVRFAWIKGAKGNAGTEGPFGFEKPHKGNITSITYLNTLSESREWFATTSEDLSIRIWDAVTKECIWTLEGQHETETAAVFMWNEETLVTVGEDGKICFWDTTGEMKEPFFVQTELSEAGWQVHDAKIMGDGRLCVSTNNNSIYLFEEKEAKE